MRLALELLVLLFFLCPLCTTLGTCRPVTTEKLPFHTCRGQRIVVRTFKETKRQKQCDETTRTLTMNAGMTGCWNLVLNECISCLVLAL